MVLSALMACGNSVGYSCCAVDSLGSSSLVTLHGAAGCADNIAIAARSSYGVRLSSGRSRELEST